jgi:hypothetical protein
VCAVLVKSKRRENTGLIFNPSSGTKIWFPGAQAPESFEEILPGEGKIFTVAARSAEPHPAISDIAMDRAGTRCKRSSRQRRRRSLLRAQRLSCESNQHRYCKNYFSLGRKL